MQAGLARETLPRADPTTGMSVHQCSAVLPAQVRASWPPPLRRRRPLESNTVNHAWKPLQWALEQCSFGLDAWAGGPAARDRADPTIPLVLQAVRPCVADAT